MNKTLSDPVFRAQLPKHGFSMEQSRKVTASFGQLLPVYYDILNAGEKIRFKTKWFTRTQPLSTAAMVRVREHVEYFFVPFEQLYSLFGSFRYGINDVHSSMFDQPWVNDKLPVISWFNIRSFVDANATTAVCGDLTREDIQSSFDYLWNGAFRLFDLLGYNIKAVDGGTNTTPPTSLKFCPYTLCAYQKIFNDVYRLDDFTEPHVKAYNMDSGYNNSEWLPDMLQFLSLRYRPFYKDYFTTTKPSPLVNPKSMMDSSDTSQLLSRVNQWLGYTHFGFAENAGIDYGDNTFQPGNNQTMAYSQFSSSVDGVYGVSAPQIRTMFAIEKLAQITGRAGKHYDSQTLAHFGFEVPKGLSGEVFRLGGQSQSLQIGEVVATATTSDSTLGELAGKAYSITENAEDNEFTSPADGIFMAIYSAVPELNYESRFDKLNSKINRYDFYLPEYDNLGMQPLFAYEYWGNLNNTARSNVVGWQYRFMESKVKYNTTSYAFTTGGPFADWSIHLDIDSTGLTLDQVSLYCNPKILDSVFLVNYDNNPQYHSQDIGAAAIAVYGTDPLVIDFDFEISKASYMSPYGIPNL